jgi:hypothetical protein
MPVKNYVSRNGQVEYEYDDLGDILTYGRDALGNVVAGYDGAGSAVFTADYKPYGEFAAITGNVAGRRFMWVGSWGYRFTSGVPVSHYVRARHLSMRMGMWTSVDPLWPSEPAFGYVGGCVIAKVDFSGLRKGIVGPFRFDPEKDCNCFTRKAHNVPNPTWQTHEPPYGAKSDPRFSSQSCFDSGCSGYCSQRGTIDNIANQRSDSCSKGGLFSQLAGAKYINSILPPCIQGNPAWKGCSEPWSSAGQWQIRPHQSAYPEPSPYFTQDFCAVECEVRICCFRENEIASLGKRWRIFFEHCYHAYGLPEVR